MYVNERQLTELSDIHMYNVIVYMSIDNNLATSWTGRKVRVVSYNVSVYMSIDNNLATSWTGRKVLAWLFHLHVQVWKKPLITH